MFSSSRRSSGSRDLPDSSTFSVLKSFDAGNTALNVDRGPREREYFRDARAAPSEREAEQSYFGWRASRRLDETLPLGSIEIFPLTGRTKEIEAIVRLIAHSNPG
jgi:hypothetical protein